MESPTSRQFENPEWWSWEDDGSVEGLLDWVTFDGNSPYGLPKDWPRSDGHNITQRFCVDLTTPPPVPWLNIQISQPMKPSPSMESLPGLMSSTRTELTSPMSLYSATASTSPLAGWEDNTPLATTIFSPLEIVPFYSTLGEVTQAPFAPASQLISTSTTYQPPPPLLEQSQDLEAATFPQLTMKDRPPGIPAREWRHRVRPERCSICGRGHTYSSELSKHIAAQHPEEAWQYGVSTKRPCCDRCGKTFARMDHLRRHSQRRHGEQVKVKRREGGRLRIKG